MGIQDLLDYIEQVCPGAVHKQVDLLRVARAKPLGEKSGTRLSLVLDAETCLDRLYGGFFPDWVSGGEWNNTLHFLQSLVQACEANNIQLVLFFNGGLELQRIHEWHDKQLAVARRVGDIYRHIHTKGVPPPKVLWVPPICLTTTLRMVLRQLRVTVSYSMDDHHQEVIAYCRENNFDGILAQDAEYAIFDPPRLFSASALKLKFSGSVVSNEYILDEVAKILDLHPKRFCVFGSLLGNHILSENDLRPFHDRLLCTMDAQQRRDRKPIDVINGVVNFVRQLNSVDDLDDVGLEVFGGSTGEKEDLISRFKQCVQYYLNGTMEGFLKYLPKFLPATAGMPLLAGGYPAGVSREEEHMRAVSQVVHQQQLATAAKQTAATVTSSVTSPAEVANQEAVVNDVTVNGHPEKDPGAVGGALPTPSIVIDPPTKRTTAGGSKPASTATTPISAQGTPATTPTGSSGIPKLGDPHKLSSLSSSSSSSDGYSPQRLSPDAPWPPTGVTSSSIKFTPKSPIKEVGGTGDATRKSDRPVAPPEIIRIASERHQKGLMAPFIYQVLTQGEVKLNASFEDECYREFPPAVDFYRPVRQCMYGLLFNLASTEQEPDPPVVIKEWLVRPERHEARSEPVGGVPLDWEAPIPTIQRLWVGQHIEDKNRRLRAFLSCMGSDYSPLLLNTSYVPQHLLILCTVLRYMLLSKEQVLRRHELEAFLSQSVSPMLHARNSKHLLDLTVPSISVRGVNLSSLFMSGVETAVIANDVCGVPVPWMMCCPWMFFDGKLFQYKLLKSEAGAQIIDLCEGQMELVMRVERMRQAIMEDVKFEFASLRPFADPSRPMGLMGQLKPAGASSAPPGPISPTRGVSSTARGTGRGRGAPGRGRPLPVGAPAPGLEVGGELQVAGVVTGQWAGHQHRASTPPGFPRRPYSMPQCLRSHRGVGRGTEPVYPGGPIPPARYMADPSYEPRPRGRGPRRPGPGKTGRSKSASGRVEGAELTPSPMGRGCTVERLDGSGVFLASELGHRSPPSRDPENPDSSYESHKSPDSGIHVHPVVCEGE